MEPTTEEMVLFLLQQSERHARLFERLRDKGLVTEEDDARVDAAATPLPTGEDTVTS